MVKVTGTLHGFPEHTLHFTRVSLGISGGTFYLPQRYSVTTGADGSFEIDLPATDASEIPTQYRVTIPTHERSEVFTFQLPSAPDPVPLTDLITLPS